jgi:hypothetical protein
MCLSPVKFEVLQTFLLHDRSVKAIQISKEVGKKFPSVMMHILGLKRMGYVVSPEKGYYKITDEGKKYLGLPGVNKELAKTLLVGNHHDKAFNFYLDLNKPLNRKAYNLQTFNAQLKKVKIESVDFHMKRGDFKNWFQGIGDLELAKKTALLKNGNLTGEKLRRRFQIMIINRCIALAKIGGYTIVKK